MEGYILLGDDGELEVWATMSHGDVLLCDVDRLKCREVYDTSLYPPQGEPDYEEATDKLIAIVCGEGYIGSEFEDENFRAAILQAIAPGAPYSTMYPHEQSRPNWSGGIRFDLGTKQHPRGTKI